MLSIFKRAALVGLAVGGMEAAASAQSDVKLQGAGATFPNPLYQRWVTDYQKSHPSVKIDYQSVGSGAGIKGFTEHTVDFGASDAPISKKEQDEAAQAHEKLGGMPGIIQIPTCAGSVVPAYNLPGFTGEIKFTGEILADIYAGKISKWNDAKLAAINSGVKLPDTAITPAYRTDGSGTNFVWTSYLATQSESFKETIGVGKQVKWPVGQGGKGNEGVTAAIQGTAGAVGYIELDYAVQNKIPFGSVKNKDGKFIKASAGSVSAAGEKAAESFSGTVLKADIWNQPGENAYPISAFTYIIVYKDLVKQTKDQADALVDFLAWATTDGQSTTGKMNYAPLAPAVRAKVQAALSEITYKGAPVLSKKK
jgi:phosphate transport system substrate-binding protein